MDLLRTEKASLAAEVDDARSECVSLQAEIEHMHERCMAVEASADAISKVRAGNKCIGT